MTGIYDYRKYAILYVDDEEQSLKYFAKAFEGEFRTLTAANVRDALRILEEHTNIGIVITDQRMPEKTGVDLLGQLRRERGHIIRILTTAYSDLNSAIEAVNSGAIYKYIVKPWDLRNLRGELLRAMEFYIVQRERDELFHEKLSVLQRLIITDRIRSLAYLAAGLSHHIRNSMQALIAFLDLAPERFPQEWPAMTQKPVEFWQDMWSLAKGESDRILGMVQKVAEAVTIPIGPFTDEVEVGSILRTIANRLSAQTKGSFDLHLDPALPEVRTNDGLIERLLTILLQQVARMSAGQRVRIQIKRSQVGSTPGLSILLQGEGDGWADDKLAALFVAFAPSESDPRETGLDLLAAFFITHHHGGDLIVHKSKPVGPAFELILPLDPRQVSRPELQADLLEKLFLRFEAT